MHTRHTTVQCRTCPTAHLGRTLHNVAYSINDDQWQSYHVTTTTTFQTHVTPFQQSILNNLKINCTKKLTFTASVSSRNPQWKMQLGFTII